MALKDDLLSARPGAVLTFVGKQVLGKIQGVRGTAALPITVIGADDTATLVPDRSYRAAVLRPEGCAFLQFGQFRVDGDGWAERGIQVFSDDVKGYDLEVRGQRFDAVHTTGSRLRFSRVRTWGGTEWLRPGVGPHSGYASVLDGGGDVSDITFEDWEAFDCLGAVWQGNGEDRRVRNLTLARVKAHGWLNGFCVNLPSCAAVSISDIWAETGSAEVNGGVWTDGGGVVVTRYHFSMPMGKPQFTGSIQAIPGPPAPPAPPRLGGAPVEPPVVEPPPVEDTCPAQLAAANAKLAEWEAWAAQMPAP